MCSSSTEFAPLNPKTIYANAQCLYEIRSARGFEMSTWNKDILKIRDAISALRYELEHSQPKDRLEYVSAIMQCIQFMKQSNIGWASLLTNPQMANQLDEESLKDIFSKFRKTTVERIDNDVDSINRYMINLVPRDIDTDSTMT